jgi:hypothetical protein
MIEDPATLSLFFDTYGASTPPLSSNALECLVRAHACVRDCVCVCVCMCVIVLGIGGLWGFGDDGRPA